MTTSKFCLAISEIFCPLIHGLGDDSDPDIPSKFLVYSIITPEEFYDDEHEELIEMIINQYNIILNNTNNELSHPNIRNYRNVARDFIRLDIVNLEMLYTEELVCTHHTFWIKFIQRKWKKIYNERKNILNYRKKINNMRDRELTGKYKLYNHSPEFKLGIM